jgi:hypothetical protein
MNEQTESQHVPRSTGFLREGLRELGRKLERRKLRKQSQQQEQERSAAFVRLGQRAWQENVDLSGFAGLCDQLTQLEGRAGELSASTQELEGQKASLESRQREETDKFDGQRKAVEEKKRPVDDSLRMARQREGEQQRATQRITARQASLAAELAAVEQKLAVLAAGAAPDQVSKLSAVQAKKQQLQGERSKLAEDLVQAQANLPPAKAEVERLSAESQRCEAEINRIEAERRTALSPILSELRRVEGQLATVRQQASVVAGARTERFKQLGQALYESKSAEPVLAPGIEQIAATDRARGATQAALEASFGLTRTMLPGTMLKFWSTVVLLPVLLIGLGFGVYAGWAWWQERHHAAEGEEEVEVNPYLDHPLNHHPAYLLADRAWAASDEKAARAVIEDLCRKIGLGVYTADGTPVIAGSERNQDDFFIYDFEVGILARALVRRNGTTFGNYAGALEKNTRLIINKQKIPFPRDLLVQGLLRRYQKAVSQPNDPYSFLILFVDGLARRHDEPTSIETFVQGVENELVLDPLQTFLISLDIFTKPGNPAAKSGPLARLEAPTALFWSCFAPPSVYADSPCDKIHGSHEAAGAWGMFLDVLHEGLEALEGVAEEIGSFMGKATKVADVAQISILAYGVTLTVKAEPTKMHLHHVGEDWKLLKLTAHANFDPGKIPEDVIKCGGLAGMHLPAPGDIPDMVLYWQFNPGVEGYFELDETMANTPEKKAQISMGRTKTDDKGDSEFRFVPLICKTKQGSIVGRDVHAHVTAQLMSAPSFHAISMSVEYAANFFGGVVSADTKFRGEKHEKKPKTPQRAFRPSAVP